MSNWSEFGNKKIPSVWPHTRSSSDVCKPECSTEGRLIPSDLMVVGFDAIDEADKVLLKLESLKKEYFE